MITATANGLPNTTTVDPQSNPCERTANAIRSDAGQWQDQGSKRPANRANATQAPAADTSASIAPSQIRNSVPRIQIRCPEGPVDCDECSDRRCEDEKVAEQNLRTADAPVVPPGRPLSRPEGRSAVRSRCRTSSTPPD